MDSESKVDRHTQESRRPVDSPVVCTACMGMKGTFDRSSYYYGPCPVGVLWKTGTAAEHVTIGPSYPPYH